MSRKKNSTCKKIQKNKNDKKDKNDDIVMQLLEDPNVLGEHITLFNNVVSQYDEIAVETPIFIYQNLDLIKLRIAYFSLSMNDKLEEEKESVTDNVKESILNNDYINYLQTVSNYYSQNNI